MPKPGRKYCKPTYEVDIIVNFDFVRRCRPAFNEAWGQFYKTFYTLGQIYKLVLKLDKMIW